MTMVITPQQNAIIQYYPTDGIATTFVYNFLILLATDVAVYVTPSGQAANPVTDLVPSSDYTVTGLGVISGGTIIFNTAPAITSTVTITRNMQLSITTQFNDAQTFNGQSLDNAFQRIVLLLQQMQGNYTINAGQVGSISRCLQYVIDTYLPNQENNILPLLTNMDNQVWISQGGAIVAAVLQNDSLSTLRTQLAVNTPTGSGATLIGYYDQNSGTAETVNQYLNTSNIYGVDTGSVNALAFNTLVSSQFTGYQKGMIVRVLVANTNTSTATININSIGMLNIKRSSSVGLQAGDLIAGQIAEMQFDGTEMLLLGILPSYYGADTSVSANTITVSLNTPLASYSAGMPIILVKIANTNTGATTININGLGAKAVVLPNSGALIGNELYTGMLAMFAYDGTNAQLLNPARVFATNAQTLAGVINNLPVTPAGIASGMTFTSSYVTLPGGLIIQWGVTAAVAPGGITTKSFPITFPTALLSYSATPVAAGTGIVLYGYVNGSQTNASQIQIKSDSASTGNGTWQFIAIGY